MPELPNDPQPGIISPTTTVQEAVVQDAILQFVPVWEGGAASVDCSDATLVGVPTS
ncbi:hypothetical protein GCM10027320_26500 [Massilia solisilvae]